MMEKQSISGVDSWMWTKKPLETNKVHLVTWFKEEIVPKKIQYVESVSSAIRKPWKCIDTVPQLPHSLQQLPFTSWKQCSLNQFQISHNQVIFTDQQYFLVSKIYDWDSSPPQCWILASPLRVEFNLQQIAILINRKISWLVQTKFWEYIPLGFGVGIAKNAQFTNVPTRFCSWPRLIRIDQIWSSTERVFPSLRWYDLPFAFVTTCIFIFTYTP